MSDVDEMFDTSNSERLDWIVLGRLIGTATGWDQADTFVIMLYDFEPVEALALDLPSGGVNIDFESGKLETYDEHGDTLVSVDLVSAIAHLPVTVIE